MKDTLILILKGFIIGIGKIIPGVSGGMIAITLNVYDQGIQAISDFFKDIKKHFVFLTTLGLGIILAILTTSKLIDYSLNHFFLPTLLLFIGLILGGLPSIIHEVKDDYSLKNIFILLIPIIIIITLSLATNYLNSATPSNPNFFILIILGIIDAVTMIIPGISGTAILMMLGYYDMIITSFSTFTNWQLFYSNISILVPFILGIIIGVILLAKIINYVLNKYHVSCYYAIIGFSISSILVLIKTAYNNSYNYWELLIGFLLLIIGYCLSRKLDNIN